VPTATMTSHSAKAFCAAGTADAPKPNPTCSGWLPGKDRQALQGRGDRRFQPFGEADEVVVGVTRAPAGEDAGVPRVAQQFRGARHVGGRVHARRRRGPELRQLADLLRHHQNVDRQFDEHRPGLARGRNRVGLEPAWARPGHGAWRGKVALVNPPMNLWVSI